MAPPELSGNAPVADVVRPVEINLVHALRNQADVPVLHAFYGRLDQLAHLHEPLLLDQRLHRGLAAVMGSHVVGIVLDAHQKPHLVQLLHDGLPGLVTVHSGELSAVFIDGGIVVHDVDLRKVVPLSHLEVVRVMGGGDLHHAGPEFHVHIRIRNDGDQPVHEGQKHLSSHQILIARILRVHGHCRISQHGLRTGGGELQELRFAGLSVLIRQRIFDVPEMACLLLIHHLRVGNGGVADRTPVDDPAALVDPALFMHLAEHFRNGLIAALVHGEALSVPVAGGAQLL